MQLGLGHSSLATHSIIVLTSPNLYTDWLILSQVDNHYSIWFGMLGLGG